MFGGERSPDIQKTRPPPLWTDIMGCGCRAAQRSGWESFRHPGRCCGSTLVTRCKDSLHTMHEATCEGTWRGHTPMHNAGFLHVSGVLSNNNKKKRPVPMVPFFGECPLRAQDCTCASGHVCVVGGAGQPSGWLLCTPFVEHTGIVRVELPLTTAIRAVHRSPLLRGGFSRSSNPLCRCLSSPLPRYSCKDSLQQAPWSGTSLYEMLVAFTFVHYDWS